MRSGGAAPSRWRCNSTLGSAAQSVTGSSGRGVRGRGRGGRRSVSPTSAKPIGPNGRGARPGPKASTGTRSRVWSVPFQVGSLPWSAVMTRRSPGRSAARSSGRRASKASSARGVAGHVAAVAVKRVEVDEVGEDEVAVAGGVDRRERGVDERHVVRAFGESGDAAVGEDVADLADACVRPPAATTRSSSVRRAAGRQSPCGWRYGRRRRGLADEGAGDDPADVQRVGRARRRCGRSRRAARGRNASRARRSAARSRRRCRGSACRCGCAPRRRPR